MHTNQVIAVFRAHGWVDGKPAARSLNLVKGNLVVKIKRTGEIGIRGISDHMARNFGLSKDPGSGNYWRVPRTHPNLSSVIDIIADTKDVVELVKV